MAAMGDLIDFDVIESHKENIQALPSGRSAKALAQIYSPPLAATTPALLDDANVKARAAFERELLTIDEADDPLDIYDRYVKWTVDAYPTAQATPQSQLLTLLERATKAFQSSVQYKNDSRYVKLWLQYIRLFSDAPREVFIFMARNNIGEGLALYYEEYAAWLENAARWNQAEEIYELSIQKNARPVERLNRKYNEFQRRRSAVQSSTIEPTSPALPVARPALAAKIDPYAAAPAQQQGGHVPKKPKSNKMQIFADSTDSSRPNSSESSSNWKDLGTLSQRRRENHKAAEPMAGATLKTGKTNGGVQKMMVFKDSLTKQALPRHLSNRTSSHAKQCVVNPSNGKTECVAINLEAVYPGNGRELCFEELRAKYRGWHVGAYPPQPRPQETVKTASPKRKERGFKIFEDALEPAPAADNALATKLAETLILDQENDENSPPDASQQVATKRQRKDVDPNRTRKIELPDVKHNKNETKTIQLNLDSPSGTKPKRKKSIAREATVTINTKEAMDEIYGIFSQPLPSQSATADIDDSASSEDDSSVDDESVGTGRVSAPASEYGEETRKELFRAHDEAAWSDYDVQERRDEHDAELPGFESEQEDLLTSLEENHKAQSIPLQTEDHGTPAYRQRYDGAIPNHRLLFMTPIAEATESSLGTLTAHQRKELVSTKTPSRQTGTLAVIDDEELMSSPFQEITPDLDDVRKRILQPIRTKSTKGTIALGQGTAKSQITAQIQSTIAAEGAQYGPAITDLQCNPMDPALRDNILLHVRPDVSTYEGYRSYDEEGGKTAEIRRWAKAVAKTTRHSGQFDRPIAPVIQLDGTSSTYTIRRELGAGTFAPVYLVENSAAAEQGDNHSETQMGNLTHRHALEAIKMEDPPSVWEWYIINLTHRRLGVSRAAQSVIRAHEMHVFKDECFLIEEYRDQGTLLDLVNICRSDNINTAAGNDEMLAMWLTVELLRTVEALHAKHIIHGDLKGDNMMVRFDDPGVETDWSSTYFASGAHGWSSKGVCLIDFGRGIDMKQFEPNVGFVADWKTTEADCAEMREMRPWTYQVDYHGLAGTIHSLLFGKYMETISERGSGLPGQGATKTYRIRESFKRYWQIDVWTELFQLLLNPLAHLEAEEGRRLPALRGMAGCREKMESWLEENCEKGVGLKNMVVKLESTIKERKRKSRASA